MLVNGMMWFRPAEVEINKLETLGNPGWNWVTLLPVSTPGFQLSKESEIPLLEYNKLKPGASICKL